MTCFSLLPAEAGELRGIAGAGVGTRRQAKAEGEAGASESPRFRRLHCVFYHTQAVCTYQKFVVKVYVYVVVTLNTLRSLPTYLSACLPYRCTQFNCNSAYTYVHATLSHDMAYSYMQECKHRRVFRMLSRVSVSCFLAHRRLRHSHKCALFTRLLSRTYLSVPQ